MDTRYINDHVFRPWKSARISLTRAINDYLTASAGLCKILSSSAYHSSRCSFEQAHSGIDHELPSLQSEEERLKEIRTALANERNKSRLLNPVCKLPPEILAMIFVIATSRYMRCDRTTSTRTHSSPIVLSSISSSWRNIALSTPSLWSYINLTIGSQPGPLHLKQAELWVERSRQAGLCVDILGRTRHLDRYAVPEYQIISLSAFLAPLMHRIRALEIDATQGALDMLSSVLPFWAKHGPKSVKRTLQIVDYTYGSSDVVLGPAPDGSLSTDEFNSLFQSIHRLVVFNCRISERVMFHEGLVELHLQRIGAPHCPTQQELAAMLATAPRLRELVLANCWIEPSEEIPNPVTLNHLQFLSLESQSESHGFVHVLPLLAIGSEGLSMSLTLDEECDFIDEARAFFGRTKVTRLHVWAIQGYIPLSMLLYPIPHLETLALDNFEIPNEYTHTLVPLPRLHTLYLKDPLTDARSLQQLVQPQRSLKKLHIYRPYTGREPESSMTAEECAHLAESMHMVEDFKIEFDWGSRTIGTWDFVILDIW